MRLTHYTDYSLRVLIYLGLRPERLSSIREIAAAYGISESHLMKVVQALGKGGYVATLRGRGGGLKLAKSPSEIGVGEVVRRTEDDVALADCFVPGPECRNRRPLPVPASAARSTASFFRGARSIYARRSSPTQSQLVEGEPRPSLRRAALLMALHAAPP